MTNTTTYQQFQQIKYTLGSQYLTSDEKADNEFRIKYWVSFTEDEIKKIKNRFKSWTISKEIYSGVDKEALCIKAPPLRSIKIYENPEIRYFYIYKLKDEWYYILTSENLSYRCDQWDGLEDCLRKEIAKKAYPGLNPSIYM